MEMTERKKKVLRCIVDLYIRTAEPVGSKAIAPSRACLTCSVTGNMDTETTSTS